MNIGHIILWGFLATVVLTALLFVFQGMHYTRINIPFLLGTIWTEDRDRAKWTGSILHLLFGWVFAFIYFAIFEDTGVKTWWFGGIIGFAHAMFVLSTGMNILAALHPRMANEERGPEPTRMLEPPGFMVLNYGRGTPIATIIAHVIYGIILGTFSHFI